MGALAAMLALTGVFGMASYAVSRRFRELGIRMALGAARRQILLAAIGRPVQLLALGSILGLAAGALASKLLAVVVYQASSRDPLVLFGVVLGMAGIGALAAWIPARRALAIEPSRLLRED
jgi:ABC-type antimicrobial peptide transport system permease subunit